MNRTSYRRRLGYGCLLPIILVISFIIFRLNFRGGSVSLFIPDINIRIGIDKAAFSREACLYISKNDSLSPDCIKFRYTDVTAPSIYYVRPDTIYIVDKDNSYITDIKSKQFVVKYVNHIFPPDITREVDSATFYGFLETMEKIEREDSIIKSKPHYSISFHGNANGFSVFNPSGERIKYVSLKHWLF